MKKWFIVLLFVFIPILLIKPVVKLLSIPKKLISMSELLPLWRSKFALQVEYDSSMTIIRSIVERFGLSVEDLLMVMYFESKFSNSIQNSIGATGLIQFIPKTATALGTSVLALRNMSHLKQMEWVKKYFFQYPKKNITFEQFYLLVLRGQLVTPSHEKEMLIDYFGTYLSPGKGGRQAKYLYGEDGFITLSSVRESFKTMFP